ncbi:hypothetical protein PRIC1_005067 [Phytophthora ramorum]|nr:hypothetical protein KRP22_1968 [Phytophthora ramorum]
MGDQEGWTTSPTGPSERQWGVSSSAKLATRPARQAAKQSVSNFEKTLRPFEQTIDPFGQTEQQPRRSQRPLQQTPKLSRPSRIAQQQARPSQSQQRQSHQGPRRQSQAPARQSQRVPQRRTSEQPTRPSQPAPDHVRSFGRSLGPTQPVANHRSSSAQPPRRQSQQIPDYRARNFECSLGPSRPAPNLSTQAQQAPRPAQQIPTGFPSLERHRSDKSTSSGGSSNSEPLVELSPARRREIISRVNESVQNIMASMLSDSSSNVQWKPKLRKKDISYYMDESSVKPGQSRFCCVTHTHATVDEIMKFFLISDSDSLLRNNRLLYDNLLETRILSVLRRPTKERPMSSMYVKYSSFQTPGLMVNRDTCVAVATDMLRQPDGSTIGYCLWDSVDDPEFAEATKKPGLEFCPMFRSGFFLRRSGRRQSSNDPAQGYTKIVYMVGIEPGGWAPGLTARLLMERFGSTLTRVCSHFRRKQLDSRTFVMKTQWVSKLSAKSCKQCSKSFQVLSSRVNCHACGHVVCRSCASKELVELHAVGLVPMHICYSCLEKAGLPTPLSAQKDRATSRRRRLQSDTASISRGTAQAQAQPLSRSQPQHQSKSVIESDLIEEDDDDDTDTGEWAFTPSGVPVRPYRMAS